MADIAELADKSPGSIRLENADSDYPPPEHILEATRQAVGRDEFNSYLPLRGLESLRRAVSERYYSDYGVKYDPSDEIVVTSGAGEALLDTLLSFVDPGDKVVLTNPTYNGIAQRVKLAGGAPTYIELQEARGWHFDPADVSAKMEGSKLVLYASPSLPTGTVFTREETNAIVEAAEKNDALIVFDGAMEKIVYDDSSVILPATLRSARDRTIVVSSVSKNYSMMGWRVGWVCGPRELVRHVENTHIFNGLMPSGINQAGAQAALSGPQEWLNSMRASFQRRRDILIGSLEHIPSINIVKSEGGYSFIANIERLGVDSTTFSRRLLSEKNVATTPMVAWGRDNFGHSHVRFVFTNENEQRLAEAGHRIHEYVSELRGQPSTKA